MGVKRGPLYRRHIKQLKQLHTRSLRTILSICWQGKVTNQEVLDRTRLASIESMLLKAHIRWTGHVLKTAASPDS